MLARLGLASVLAVNAMLACGGQDLSSGGEENNDMKIRLIIGDATLTATLVNGTAARDFVLLLPLELTLRDYAGKEKVSDLPRRLTIDHRAGSATRRRQTSPTARSAEPDGAGPCR